MTHPETDPEPIEYEDMTPEQQRIVDAVKEPRIRVPSGMTKDELIAWMRERLGV